AGGVFALASAGAAMTAAAADAMFLSELGAGHLGEAVAASSALLAIVLAVIGGLADRLERRRVLASLSIVSAVVIAGLAALSIVMPRAAAAITLVGGKQLAAATDLAFWVVIAERLDARRSQRLVPLLAAAGGAGAAVGAVLVIPLAPAVGARGVLVTAALVLVLAGIGATRLPATRRVAALPARVGTLIARSWRDGARAVRRYPLAMHLAVVVAAAGVFASLAYFALGVAVANLGDSTADRTALLGGVRGVGQILTLVVQLALASRLLTRLGTGRTLLLAPLVALAAGLGLVVAPILAVAIATQISARVLDGGVETPAEKLAQTLLPTAVRGRVAGFLDGPAKRTGAVAGGLVAAALAGVPTVFYVSTAVAAALWFLAARRISRELPTLAVEHVVGTADADAVVDDRAIAELLGELASDRVGGRFPRERAADVLVRLHERGRIDAVPPLVRAVVARPSPALWRSLVAVLDVPADAHGPALAAIAATGDELAIRAIGLAGGVSPEVVTALASRDDLAVALAAEIAGMRLSGETDEVVARLGDAIRDSGAAARVAVAELGIEIARALACDATDRAIEAARHVARALRRGRGDVASRTAGFVALARVIARVRDRRDAELSLLRADLLELVRERVESGASKPAPEHMLVSVMRTPDPASLGDDAPELAAAIALYGALLDGADAVDPDDLRRIARALGEADDEVSAAAEDVLGTLGGVAAGELVATVAWGRRRARDRAAALLAQLPVTAASLDRLIDHELDTLDRTHAAIAALGGPGDQLVARRLDERLHEIAHTVLLLVAAQRRSPAIARAAIAWRHARGGQERARALAVIDAALPRALVGRLVEAVDDLTPADRAAQLAAADQTPPDREVVMRAELGGRDR
ncbi:MAG TPA: MFS transporter, partial [Kofleriaceae bacterium]|nr:MFS transporter [Kofleriaceae bacterium]